MVGNLLPFPWLRETPITWNKVIGDHRNETLPWRINDPATYNSGRIAAKSHTHGQRLFTACTALFKGLIEIICHTRKISGVFQQCEKREKDRHRWQHYRYHPCKYPVYSKHKHPVKPIWRAHILEEIRQTILNPK